jgi:hypothetical protein
MRRLFALLLLLGSTALAQVPLPATGKFPSLMVQVTVGTPERAGTKDFYHKNMHIQPRASIQGASSMLPIPAAEIEMLIVTMDTRAKFVDHKDSFKILSTETLPVPAVPTGVRRQFNFADSDITYDGYRDNTNAGGDLYKYYVFALRDPETKAIIDFQTNCLQLLNFSKAHPEKREAVLKLAKGDKFPNEFK